MSPKGRNSVHSKTTARYAYTCLITNMNTVIINSVNPIIEFYSKFLYLMKQMEWFDETLAENLVEIAKNPNITLEVDVEYLKDSFEKILEDNDESFELVEEFTMSCFEDLSSQMRTEAARDLFRAWVRHAGNFEDLFIHMKRQKELGDGFAAITIVTNDIDRLKKLMYKDQIEIHTTEC